MSNKHAWDDYTQAPAAFLIRDGEMALLADLPPGTRFLTEDGQRLQLVSHTGGAALCAPLREGVIGSQLRGLLPCSSVWVDDRLQPCVAPPDGRLVLIQQTELIRRSFWVRTPVADDDRLRELFFEQNVGGCDHHGEQYQVYAEILPQTPPPPTDIQPHEIEE